MISKEDKNAECTDTSTAKHATAFVCLTSSQRRSHTGGNIMLKAILDCRRLRTSAITIQVLSHLSQRVQIAAALMCNLREHTGKNFDDASTNGTLLFLVQTCMEQKLIKFNRGCKNTD
eukprot:gnl/TRDRNA2_/TRDRNA2_192457_c0_seq1.p1 gnl/TRDRNA2_/TRDRNA2_192457_c0~~gnl/TRDRNA2_/TRDRNA2_192457_c0_seq1.p1  ORF type:complete len:118 (-),score=19.46 gnl/TRDRNA2_/TRDRNA2_192457_c0_seq1:23-376(-)